jgi:imidazolonepropionase
LRQASKNKLTANRALLLTNVGQLLTLRSPSGTLEPRRGRELSELGIVKDAAVLCLGGKIVSVGTTKEALRDPWLRKENGMDGLSRVDEIDCQGQVVLPGFVDSHTHPAFIEPRLLDFERRIRGATYEEIAHAGGGIRSSVESVRKASKTGIAEKVLSALCEMGDQGTTTVEAKSGYGLTLASELKSLAAIRVAADSWPGTVVSTLLGAHTVPPEFHGRAHDYVQLVCQEMIPRVAKRKLARFVDVFAEKTAFTLQEAAKVFVAARKHNLEVRAHVCQLSESSLVELLAFRPASLDHMDYVSPSDIRRLAEQPTIVTLLPGANYFLGLKRYPPARELIDAGAPVALATDYNPGSSPTPSMPFILSLACTHMRMSPAEAIVAATLNGAWGLRLQDRKGSIEPGKDADLAIFDVRDYREIPYWFAFERCKLTIFSGQASMA